MSDIKDMTPGEILADSSVADFISELGLGIAAAQTALDDNSVRQFEAFATRRDDLGGRSLLDLGLSPAFYHYQHADITCSMQLRMEVGSSDEFGFGIKAGFGDTDSSSDSSDTTEMDSESGSSAQIKSAGMTMRADSQGALVLSNGQSFTPEGDDPASRLADLRRLLTEGNSGIDTLIERAPTTGPDIALKTPTERVYVKSPSIAFLRPNSDHAAFRVRENQDIDFVVNASLTVSTTTQADLPAYASYFEVKLKDERFTTRRFDPADRRDTGDFGPRYGIGISDLRPQDEEQMAKFANVLKSNGLKIEIEGFTDRQGKQARNIVLGTARAEKLREFLVKQGVPAAQIVFPDPPSRGEAQHRADDPTGPENNQEYRKTSITILNLEYYLITAGNGPDFDPERIAPKDIGNWNGPGNAYVALYSKVSLSTELSGNGVTVDGTTFDFNGAASGGRGPGTAESYANNLARDINATTNLSAWANGNVVNVARAQDKFHIQLFTKDSRELRIAESSGFVVTTQFTRTRRSVESKKQDSNRTMAVGVSIDGRFSRQFNLDVTGNSAISARLVSVPAPPEFLEQIRAYQNGLDQ